MPDRNPRENRKITALYLDRARTAFGEARVRDQIGPEITQEAANVAKGRSQAQRTDWWNRARVLPNSLWQKKLRATDQASRETATNSGQRALELTAKLGSRPSFESTSNTLSGVDLDEWGIPRAVHGNTLESLQEQAARRLSQARPTGWWDRARYSPVNSLQQTQTGPLEDAPAKTAADPRSSALELTAKLGSRPSFEEAAIGDPQGKITHRQTYAVRPKVTSYGNGAIKDTARPLDRGDGVKQTVKTIIASVAVWEDERGNLRPIDGPPIIYPREGEGVNAHALLVLHTYRANFKANPRIIQVEIPKDSAIIEKGDAKTIKATELKVINEPNASEQQALLQRIERDRLANLQAFVENFGGNRKHNVGLVETDEEGLCLRVFKAVWEDDFGNLRSFADTSFAYNRNGQTTFPAEDGTGLYAGSYEYAKNYGSESSNRGRRMRTKIVELVVPIGEVQVSTKNKRKVIMKQARITRIVDHNPFKTRY